MTVATKQYPVAETFNLPVPQNTTIEGRDKHTEFVPAITQSYYFREDLFSDVMAWWKHGNSEGLFLTGPTGSGKSSVIIEVAGRINYPVQRVIGHSRLELPELCGQWIVVNGNMQYVHGPLATAMKEGHIFLLDEIDLLDPAVLVGLNMVLEGAPLSIPENGGELIHPVPGFKFVCTGNSTGTGDMTGYYQGVLAQNMALLDRLWVVKIDYAPEDVELQILVKTFNIPKAILKQFVTCATNIRRGHEGGLGITMSTRVLIRWIMLTSAFRPLAAKGIIPVYYALDRAILFRASLEDRQTVHGIIQRVMGLTPPADANTEDVESKEED